MVTKATEKNNAMSEDRLQMRIILWWDAECERFGAKPWELMHIPNGLLNPNATRKVLPLGVRKGYPDLMLPIPRGNYAGLFIELKSPTVDIRRAVSNDQKKVLKTLMGRGYCTAVCQNFYEVTRLITSYLEEL